MMAHSASLTASAWIQIAALQLLDEHLDHIRCRVDCNTRELVCELKYLIYSPLNHQIVKKTKF